MGRVRNIHGGTEEYTQVFTTGRKGSGGAYHHYEINVPVAAHTGSNAVVATIDFQKGPIQVAGANGCSNEDLLAIVKDRLECFQKGKFACGYNESALRHIKTALDLLRSRTADRKRRGVEGKNVK